MISSRSYVIVASLLLLPTLLMWRAFAANEDISIQDSGNYRIWLEKTLSEPDNSEAFFKLGVIYHRNKLYSKAIDAYKKAADLHGPSENLANFYAAKALYSLGKRTASRRLVRIVRMDKLPERQRSLFLNFKKLLNEEDADDEPYPGTGNRRRSAHYSRRKKQLPSEEQSLRMFIDASVGANSNPALVNDDQLNNSKSADGQFQLKSGASYRLWNAPTHDLKLAYYFSGTFFKQTSTSNYVMHDFTIPLALYRGDYRLRISPEYYADIYGKYPFSNARGGTVDVTRNIDLYYILLGYQFMSIDNDSEDYAHMTGTQNKPFVRFTVRGSESKFFIEGYLNRFSFRDTADLAASYSAYGVACQYSYSFHPYDLILSGQGESRTYARAENAPSERKDSRLYGSVQLGYLLGNDLRIYGEGNITKNSSSFNSSDENYNFTQMIGLVGLSWVY